jgi:DNA polymerase (family 10)
LGRALILAEAIMSEARRAGLTDDALTPLGSVRRYAADVGDVSLLAVVRPSEQERFLNDVARLKIVSAVVSVSQSTLIATTSKGTVTLHVAGPEHAGAALVWHTGARAHVARLQRRAEMAGLRFEHGRLLGPSGDTLLCQRESDVYARLDLPYIPPELRHGEDEIEAAAEGALPNLVSSEHIRGDLHTHSTWSDGRDTVRDMVAAAAALGYEYLAVTDHSQGAWATRTLGIDDVHRQRDEIEALREENPGLAILHGVEVEILTDGSLDFDDDLLEQFDIVLASLHDHGGQDGSRLTERYARAIRHPLVNVITHPANRVPAQSSGYDLDFTRLFALAAETGTAMEIDGAPVHLDMDGALARRAVSANVTLAIDSDCHRAEWLGRQMQLGIGTARRGWVRPSDVLNARRLADVRAFVASKRRVGQG